MNLAQSVEYSASASGVGGLVVMLIMFAVIGFFIFCMWRVFEKAGEPGWATLIPIYNTIVMIKIAKKPVWWFFILWLVIPYIIVMISFAKQFGKTAGFGWGLMLLGPIFFPILALGDAQYQGGAGVPEVPPTAPAY